MLSNSSSPADEARLDRVFRALGDTTRRRILQRLADGSARISELAAPFDMSLPAIGKHIRVLERAGLVEREIDGRVHHCSLSPVPLRDVNRWMAQYQRFWDENLAALARHFESSSDDD